MIPCVLKRLKHQQHRYLKTFGCQIETEGFLRVEEAILLFLAQNVKNSKVRPAKDHGKMFRSRLAAFFSGIVHCR